MKHSEKATSEKYGISRYDDEKRRSHGWRVSLRRHGKRLVENFPDKKHGGRQQALKLAQKFRDGLLRKFPPISRKEVCLIKRSNNQSGISGVCTYTKKYTLRDGSQRETWYWEASWPGEDGKKVSVNFSVNKYGEELARSMAIRARKLGLDGVKGAFWVSARGVVKTPGKTLLKTSGNKTKRVA